MADDELTAWLRAQILADRAVAEAATPGPWAFDGDDDEVYTCHDGELGDQVGSPVAYVPGAMSGIEDRQEANGVHVALNDPRDRIADCDAKLTLLDEIDAQVEACDGPDTICIDYYVARMLRVIIAYGYQHRPGYKAEEWKR